MTAIASSPADIGGETTPNDDAAARPRRWPHVLGVGLLTSLFATIYSAYLLGVHAQLQDGLADVGEYDQAISGYAHFMGPHSPFIGLNGNPNSAGVLQLSDHFTPLLALLAPFYWIHDGPETLLIETAVLGALPIIPLWLFTRRAVGEFRTAGTIAAYFVAVAYGLAWPLQEALAFQFHEVFLAIPIMMWMIERAQAGRLRQAAVISLLLLGVKDDMGFIVAVFGVYLATKDATIAAWWRLARRTFREPRRALGTLLRRDRLWLLALVPVGLGMVLLVNRVLLPHYGGSPTRNFTYTEFGATPTAALHAMLAHPATVVHTLYNSPIKTSTLHMLLRPVLGLFLLSPLSLMVVPLLIERFLSVNTLYWKLGWHYNAFLLPMIFCGAVDGAARLMRWLTDGRVLRWRIMQPLTTRLDGVSAGRRLAGRGPVIRGVLLAGFAFYLALFAWQNAHRYPLYAMTKAPFWNTSSQTVTAGKRAAAHVPDNVLVAAGTQLGPQLLSRDRVIMWDAPGDRDYPLTPWVIADVSRTSWPFRTIAEQRADVDWLKLLGYQVVYQEDGWIVLHQGPPVTAVH